VPRIYPPFMLESHPRRFFRTFPRTAPARPPWSLGCPSAPPRHPPPWCRPSTACGPEKRKSRPGTPESARPPWSHHPFRDPGRRKKTKRSIRPWVAIPKLCKNGSPSNPPPPVPRTLPPVWPSLFPLDLPRRCARASGSLKALPSRTCRFARGKDPCPGPEKPIARRSGSEANYRGTYPRFGMPGLFPITLIPLKEPTSPPPARNGPPQ